MVEAKGFRIDSYQAIEGGIVFAVFDEFGLHPFNISFEAVLDLAGGNWDDYKTGWEEVWVAAQPRLTGVLLKHIGRPPADGVVYLRSDLPGWPR